MKKLFIFFLASLFVLSLASCDDEPIPHDQPLDPSLIVSDSSKPEEPLPSEPEEPASEPEEEAETMTFALGLDGDTVSLAAGDILGDWRLEKLEITRDPSGEISIIDADFSGNVVLNGYIERNNMLEYAYDFIVSEEDRAKLPFIVLEEFGNAKRCLFILSIPDDIGDSLYLDFGEKLDCKITVSGCSRSFSYTEGADGLDIVKIEPAEP